MLFRVSKMCIIGKYLPCQKIYAIIKSVLACVYTDKIKKASFSVSYAAEKYKVFLKHFIGNACYILTESASE